MQIDILTIFPEMFDGFLNTSIIKRAIENNKVKINVHNFRDYSLDKHKKSRWLSIRWRIRNGSNVWANI